MKYIIFALGPRAFWVVTDANDELYPTIEAAEQDIPALRERYPDVHFYPVKTTINNPEED